MQRRSFLGFLGLASTAPVAALKASLPPAAPVMPKAEPKALQATAAVKNKPSDINEFLEQEWTRIVQEREIERITCEMKSKIQIMNLRQRM